jgi:hypothetical protein
LAVSRIKVIVQELSGRLLNRKAVSHGGSPGSYPF